MCTRRAPEDRARMCTRRAPGDPARMCTLAGVILRIFSNGGSWSSFSGRLGRRWVVGEVKFGYSRGVVGAVFPTDLEGGSR